MKVVVVHGHRDPGCTRISAECRLRVFEALEVPANAIVFSGAGVPGERSEARQMFDLYREVRGRPKASMVVLDQRAESTAENARYGMREAVRLCASHVVVVTSWWHLPRSWLEWRRVAMPGIRVRFQPTVGSVRYVPGELVALWRWR